MIQGKNYKKYGYILIFFAILIRFGFAFFFKGQGDPWNVESFNEYLIDGQAPFGMPYLPTIYVLSYIFGVLVDWFGLFYSFWMRLGGIFAEIGILFLLFKIAKKMDKAVAFSLFVCVAYVFNPLSFQLTALHGQFDQLTFFFVLLAAYIELSNSWPKNQKTIAIALALVLATYVKPYVILFFPAFFFKRDLMKDKITFLLIYVLGCILPFALLITPRLIVKAIGAIVNYKGGSHLGWGIPVLGLPVIGDLVNIYAKFSKPVIIACVFVIGYLGRKQNILLLLLISTLVTYILSPKLASHYLYWAVPVGVIFIDWTFCLYSVVGFLWQLNFFQYLVFKGWYGNYHQFVPITSLKVFYNYWLYPEAFVRFTHFMVGGIVIPALTVVWLILLLKKYVFLGDISKKTFPG